MSPVPGELRNYAVEGGLLDGRVLTYIWSGKKWVLFIDTDGHVTDEAIRIYNRLLRRRDAAVVALPVKRGA